MTFTGIDFCRDNKSMIVEGYYDEKGILNIIDWYEMTINPNLCPTHKIEMDYENRYFVSSRIGYKRKYAVSSAKFCSECHFEMYQRITKLKEKAKKLKRNQVLSRWPDQASLFEGLE